MNKSLLKSAGLLSLIMLLSKGLGFIREIIIASYFGANQSTDAYFLASGLISNLFYSLATAISVAFLPMYTKKLTQDRDKEDGVKFATQIVKLLGVISLVISVCIYVFSDTIAKIAAPTYNQAGLNNVSMYLRILSISFVFFLNINIFNTILDVEKKYIISRSIGIIYSLIAVLMTISFGNIVGVKILAISVLIAYIIQFLVLVFKVKGRVNLKYKVKLYNKDLIELIKLSFPILISNSLVPINQLIDRTIASKLSDGAVSALSYSNILWDFISTVIITSIVTIIFTEVSKSSAEKNISKINEIVRHALSYIIIILLPITLITFLFSKDIVSIAFERGAFDKDAVRLTSNAIAYYSLGFTFAGIQAILTRVFYSLEDTKTPMINGVFSIFLNTVLTIILGMRMGIGGITLATSISLFVSAITLSISLAIKLENINFIKDIKDIIIKSLLCILIISIALLYIDNLMVGKGSFIRLICISSICMMLYFIFLCIFKCNEILEIKNIILKKER